MEALDKLDAIYDFVCMGNQRVLGGEQFYIKVAHSLRRIHNYKSVLRLDLCPIKITEHEEFIIPNIPGIIPNIPGIEYIPGIEFNLENSWEQDGFFLKPTKKYDLITVSVKTLISLYSGYSDGLLKKDQHIFNKLFSSFLSHKKEYPEQLDVYAEFMDYLIDNCLNKKGRILILDESSYLCGNFYSEIDYEQPKDIGESFRNKNSYRLECCFNYPIIIKQGPYEDIHKTNSSILVVSKENSERILLENRFEVTSNYLFSVFDQWYQEDNYWNKNIFKANIDPEPNSQFLLPGQISPGEYFTWSVEELAGCEDFDGNWAWGPENLKEKNYTRLFQEKPQKKTKNKHEVFQKTLESIAIIKAESEENKNRVLFFSDFSDDIRYIMEEYEKCPGYQSLISKSYLFKRLNETSKSELSLYERLFHLIETYMQDSEVFNTVMLNHPFSFLPPKVLEEEYFELPPSNLFHTYNEISYDHVVIDYEEGFYVLREKSLNDTLIAFQSLKSADRNLFVFLPLTFLDSDKFKSIKLNFSEFVSHVIVCNGFCLVIFCSNPQKKFFYYKDQYNENRDYRLLDIKLKTPSSWFENNTLKNPNWLAPNEDKKDDKEKSITSLVKTVREEGSKTRTLMDRRFSETNTLILSLDKEIKNIKNRDDLDDDQKLEKMNKALDENMSSQPDDIIINKKKKIKSWIKDWDFIEKPKSEIFMAQAEYLFDILEGTGDLSTFIIQYSRAFENELLSKIFIPYHNNFFKNNKDVNKMVEIIAEKSEELNSDKKRKVTNELKVFRKHLLKKDKKNYTLGSMARILELTHQKNYSFTHAELLQDFEKFIKNKIDLENNELVKNIQILNSEYRVKAAHPNLINKKKANSFYELMKETINQFISVFKR